MALLITDPFVEEQVLAERRRWEGDRYDEVWEGLYIMAPLPNDEHQEIQSRFNSVLQDALGWDSAAKIRGGVNVSDRDKDWQFNYRCPDVVVYLPDNPAINHGGHWQGGPDFLVEIASPGDRCVDMLPFYGNVGVREAMIVHRNPWALAFYQRPGDSSELTLNAKVAPGDSVELKSVVLTLVFRLVNAVLRPRIEATSAEVIAPGSRPRRWLI